MMQQVSMVPSMTDNMLPQYLSVYSLELTDELATYFEFPLEPTHSIPS